MIMFYPSLVGNCFQLRDSITAVPHVHDIYLSSLMKDDVYQKALAEGEMDVAYARIMFLGAAGVGKTSLKRSLMKQRWNPLIDSTVLSDVDSFRPIGREWQTLCPEEEEKWREVTEEDELNEMGELLAAVHQNGSNFNEFTSKVIELFPVAPMLETSAIPGEKIEEFEKSHVHSFLSKAIHRASSISDSSAKQIKPQPFLHVWDCGGQPVFLEILPAFLTSRTMFLLLYDASKSFDEKWKNVQRLRGEEKFEEEVNMTTLDLLLNWLSNIHIHLAKYDEKKALLNYPRVLCIGTHGDKLKGQTPDQKRQEIESHCKGKPFEALIEGFHIVDNTTAGIKEEDPGFSKVRTAIRDFTYNKLIVKTPISWVLFRKVIKALKANVITLEEAHAIGIACKIPSDAVPKVLLFYHDLGVLLFYPHITGLQNTVILNPRWFVDALGKVLTLKGREDYKTRLMWEILREKGILVQPLYVAAWRDVEGLDPESLINLLVCFRLAAEVKTDEYNDPSVKQYFLPLVLPLVKEASVPPRYLQKATPLHLMFRTDFVPPGFFTRFITIVAESPLCKIRFDKGVYRNRISIYFGNPLIDQVILKELPHAIQVEAIRYAPESDALEKFAHVCQELYSFLMGVAKNVDTCLFGSVEREYVNDDESESGKVFKEVKFVCAAPECQSDSGFHYLKHVKGQTCDLHLCCQNSDEYRNVLPEEGLWFPEKSTTVKKTSTLKEKEMLLISKNIPSQDILFELAVHLEMKSNLDIILQDPYKNRRAGFELLYEWIKQKGGARDRLVEVLEEVDLPQLANMVKEAEYNPEKLVKKKNKTKALAPHSAASQTPLSATTSTMPSVDDKDLIRCSRHICEDVSTLANYLGIGSTSLQEIEQNYKEVDAQAYWILKMWKEANPTTSCKDLQDKLQILGFAKAAESLVNPELPPPSKVIPRTPHYQNLMAKENQCPQNVSQVDQQKKEPVSISEITQSQESEPSNQFGISQAPPKIPPVDLISENDLLRCSCHINRNLSRLADVLGISPTSLQDIESTHEDVKNRPYWVLKKWQEVNPNHTRQDLHDKLKILGFTKAAKSLINPELLAPTNPKNKCFVM